MLDDNEWFTEVVDHAGSAFSLRVRRKLHEEQTPYQTITVYETDALRQSDGHRRLHHAEQRVRTFSITRCSPTRCCSRIQRRGGSASSAAATAARCARY
jgi:hypothetical protein